jgi:hypothetical protein
MLLQHMPPVPTSALTSELVLQLYPRITGMLLPSRGTGQLLTPLSLLLLLAATLAALLLNALLSLASCLVRGSLAPSSICGVDSQLAKGDTGILLQERLPEAVACRP